MEVNKVLDGGMNMGAGTFPSREELWRGVILGTIAHALWVAPDPMFAAAQGWDRMNYLLKDGSGDSGAVTFADEHVVAAFFDLHSPRSPHRLSPQFPFGEAYRVEDYFEGAPAAVQQIARSEALMYVFDDYRGVAEPVITAACWSEGSTLVARESWADVLLHGGRLIEWQTMPPDEAIPKWIADYEFSDDQEMLLRTLFAQKMASPAHAIVVGEKERQLLIAQGDAGMEEARELLAAVGVRLP